MNVKFWLDVIKNIYISLGLIVYTSIMCLIKQIIPYKYRCKSIVDEVTLVTGAGSGIGRLIAIKLAKLGAKLVLVDIDAKGNEKTANEILINGGYAKTFICDLSDRESIYEMTEDVKRTVGNVQILVNNAGIVTGKKLLDSNDNSIEKTFQINTLAHFWLAKSFLNSMLAKNHGHIVTIASMAGMFGSSGLSDYCSSKFAAVGFDESLRYELLRLGKSGVHTTVVCPYYINTGMFDGVKSDFIPLLEPEYVADKIVEAILTNQGILLLPRIMYFLYAIKGLFSCEVGNFLAETLFKANQAMDGFVGRKKFF